MVMVGASRKDSWINVGVYQTTSKRLSAILLDIMWFIHEYDVTNE